MPIYYGSSKIKELYKDGASIKEVYNGSDLVYKKNTPLQCWDFTTVSSMVGKVLGDYAVGSYLGFGIEDATITTIYGTLGMSGSQVKVTKASGSSSPTYSETISIKNKKYHCYIDYGSIVSGFLLVEDGSIIGEHGLYGGLGDNNAPSPDTIKTINGTTFTTNDTSYTYTINLSKSYSWSKEKGFYEE